MAFKPSDLIAIAAAEIGYNEKKSNSQLYDKEANSGYNNWTKYAKELHEAGYYNGNKNGYAWCDVFVDWCFWVMCNRDKATAEKIQFQTGLYGAGCTWSAKYYRQQKRFHTSDPKAGDQIFFGSAVGKESHTGVVEKVEAGVVYTIEGNTNNRNGVIPNGGSVCRKSYKITNTKIVGYGRPKFDVEASAKPMVKPAAKPTTNSGKKVCTVNVSQLEKGDKGTAVKSMQLLLIGHGYSVGKDGADGDFGKNTLAAVKKFQKAKKLEVDGICGANTWTALVEG